MNVDPTAVLQWKLAQNERSSVFAQVDAIVRKFVSLMWGMEHNCKAVLLTYHVPESWSFGVQFDLGPGLAHACLVYLIEGVREKGELFALPHWAFV